MSRLALVRWLVGHTRSLLPPLAISVLARIANQLLGAALLVVAAVALVRAASGGNAPRPWLLAALLAGLALAKAVLRYLEHYTGHYVAFTALQRLRELFFARLAPQAPAATTGRAGAELTARATRDIDRIEVFFAHTLPPAVSAVVVPIIAVVWLGAAWSWPLALVIAVAAALTTLGLPMLGTAASWRAAARVQAARGAVAEHLGDDIQGTREVLAFEATGERLAGLAARGDALTAARSRQGAGDGVRGGAAVLVRIASLAALVAVASLSGTGPEALAVALAVCVALWGPASGVDAFASGLDSALAAAARVQAVVDAPPVVRQPSASVSLPVARAGAPLPLVFDGVSLRYPDRQRPALDGVSLEVPAGAWHRVVGVSGSGKSSLAGLALRGWDVDAGAVRLGGVDVRQLALDELRSRIAFVPQRPTLVRGTLADNLRLAAPAAGEAELWAALRVVDLDGWAREHGLEQPLTADVSGGQLQRLALARAIVASPSVLVLDEALSQLDADTAALVLERLAAHRPLTVLEITHRADLVPPDASVTVLDAGRVVASGTAAELRADPNGPFARLLARSE